MDQKVVTPMPTVIDVKGLTKTYGQLNAVDGLDLQVEQGEIFALLGPNGAGKTTTIDILTGHNKRTSGSVEVLGSDPARDDRRWRSRVGVVPQKAATYSDIKVKEVIDHFAAFYPDPFRTGELIELVGLSSKSSALATDLSGGQLRRLDVAVGLVGKPDLIFLDEPTTGLDPEARREAWDLVRLLHSEGRTTVLTTHYLDEVEALAARAGVIAAGKMLQVGPLSELTASVGRRYRVRFAMAPLPEIDDALAAQIPDDDGFTTYTTDQPTQLLKIAIRAAERQGMAEVPSLSVSEPSFEDTYLTMLRDSRKAA